MSNQIYILPEFNKTSFNCSFCNVYAKQTWYPAGSLNINNGHVIGHLRNAKETDFCFCSYCGKYSVWQENKLIWPDYAGIDPPNTDLNDEIIEDYNEAATILHKSPRGAAAILRLALQKLCLQLGENGNDLNKNIANLVKKGLSTTIQQSLDALRVIGNESVHPGELDMKDDTETAQTLFRLLNKIADTMITEPRQIQEIYDKIPESKKKAIRDRDSNDKNI